VTLANTKLDVEVGPRSVGIVRRWVAEVCADIDRADLIDCARLGVSELVTNALLHGSPPIAVAVRGTVEHPRIEVSDGSPRPPTAPRGEGAEQPEEDAMSTTGRGLSIVAKCSIAWGAEVEGDRKVVWFEPASEVRPHVEPPYSLTLAPASTGEISGSTAPELIPVHIPGANAQACYALLKYYRDLRRELRLLALTHSDDYPLAKRLSELIISFEQEFPPAAIAQLEHALADGSEELDISVEMSSDLPPLIPQILEVLDLADAFCRAQQFLAIARTPDQNAYCHWFLGEFSRQARGAAPTRWSETEQQHGTS
jgi:anti-sigma regulatory factor (Ser/Thr protein kinase)